MEPKESVENGVVTRELTLEGIPYRQYPTHNYCFYSPEGEWAGEIMDAISCLPKDRKVRVTIKVEYEE